MKRGRRGIELTAAGESLLDHARIILHNVEAMRGDLAAYAGGMKATIRLLTNTSGLSEYLPKALAAFLGQHPHISIDVEERESADIAQAIVTGAADLGLAAEHALPDSLERIAFSEDRLVLVTARGDELAKRRVVDFRDARDPVHRGFSILSLASLEYWVARSSPTVCTHLQRASIDTLEMRVFSMLAIPHGVRRVGHRRSPKCLILIRFLRCVNHVGSSRAMTGCLFHPVVSTQRPAPNSP